MKFRTFLIIILVLAIFTVTICKANRKLSCEDTGVRGLCIEIDFKTTLDNKTDQLNRDYNFPYFTRTGDHLRMERMRIININENFTYRETTYTLNMHPHNYNKLDLDLQKKFPNDYVEFLFLIPKLGPGAFYEINYIGNNKYKHSYKSNIKEINDTEIIKDYSKKNSFFRPKLYKDGEWIIMETFKYYNYEPKSSSFGYTSLINGIWRGYIFKVNSRMDIDNLIDTKDSLGIFKKTMWAAIITLLSSAFLLLYTVILKPRNEQIRLLNKLNLELKVIEKNQKDLANLLKKQHMFPKWNVHRLSADFYAEKLGYVIKRVGYSFKKIDATPLKSLLYKLSRTIWNINNDIEMFKAVGRTPGITNKIQVLHGYKGSVISLNKTLKNELEEVKRELNKITKL